MNMTSAPPPDGSGVLAQEKLEIDGQDFERVDDRKQRGEGAHEKRNVPMHPSLQRRRPIAKDGRAANPLVECAGNHAARRAVLPQNE